MKALHEYGKLAEQLDGTPKINKEEHKQKSKSAQGTKVKIQLQIPMFHDPNSSSLDNNEADWLDNENAPFSQEPEGYDVEVTTRKDYFSSQELTEVIGNIDKQKYINKSIEVERYPEEAHSLDQSTLRLSPNIRMTLKSKDYIRVGCIRRSHENLDIWSSKITPMIPTNQKLLPRKIRTCLFDPNMGTNCDKPQFDSPLMNVNIKLKSEKGASLQPCSIIDSHIIRLPSFSIQNPLNKDKTANDSGSLLHPKECQKMFHIRKEKSIKRYRPSTSSFKSLQKKTISPDKNPFTNPMIRAHIDVVNEFQ